VTIFGSLHHYSNLSEIRVPGQTGKFWANYNPPISPLWSGHCPDHRGTIWDNPYSETGSVGEAGRANQSVTPRH